MEQYKERKGGKKRKTTQPLIKNMMERGWVQKGEQEENRDAH